MLFIPTIFTIWGLYSAWKENFNFFDGVTRTIRTFYGFIYTYFSYQYFYATHNENDRDFEEQEKKQHLKCAQRILELCLKQGGIYIKLGQYAASNNHIYPKEWTDTLKILQDKSATRTYDVIENIFFEEFGQNTWQVFEIFEKDAIASASIAQVHRAMTKEGEKVAVKIQFPEIKKRFVIDMFSHKFLLIALAYLKPNLDVRWTTPVIHGVLKQELDFLNEGKNSEKAALGFEGNLDYYIPKVYWNLTSDRVLVTEWIDGAKVTDVKKLKEMGLSNKDVMNKTMNLFAHQIFNTGFVHADPHPGNIIVRKHPTKPKQAQIVLLDHGLYKTINESTRLLYCHFYRGFVTNNFEEIKKASLDVGIEDWKTFAFIVFMRPIDLEFFNSLGISSKDALALMKDKSKLFTEFKRISKQNSNRFMLVFQKMPEEILLILRNNNILRSVNRELGDPVNRFVVFGENSIKELAKSNENNSFLFRKIQWVYYEWNLNSFKFFMWFENKIFKFLYLIGYVNYKISSEGINPEIFEELPFNQDMK